MRLDWLRKADWLHPARTRDYLRFLALLSCALIVLQLGTARGGVDRSGLLLGTDFLSFWSAGKLLLVGSSPYDVAAHIAMQRTVHVSQTGYLGYFYPPVFALWCLPLGLMGYFTALLVWVVAGLGAYGWAIRRWLPGLSRRWAGIAVAASPAVLLGVAHGQTALLVAALLGGGLWLVASGHKVAGGILLGLAIIKPQFGLLVPVVLLAGREGRAICAAVLTAAVSALIATLAFGIDEWPGWLAASSAASDALAGGLVGHAKMQSLFAGLRLLGAGTAPAFAVQAIAALGCGGVLFMAVRRTGLTREAAAATLAGSVLATPFVLDYDLVILGFPIALLATAAAPRDWERIVCLLAFAAPAVARLLGTRLGLPIMPPLVLALFVLVLRRAWAETKKAPENRGPFSEWWA